MRSSRPLAHEPDGGRRAARGALVLHGLTGTPHEVQPFAEALAARGFAVSVPALEGHGDLAALERSTWHEWYAGAERALSEVRASSARVLVLGFSLGGLLALRLAALRPADVDALVALSVPLALRRWQRRAIGVLAQLRGVRPLARLVGMLPKRGPDVRIEREFAGSPSLRGMPWPALAQLVELQGEVDRLLPHVRAPLLVLHGRLDHTAPVEDSARLVQRVGSLRVERVVLPESFHQLGLDVDREAAAAAVVEFAERELADPTAQESP
ncbi:MAG TPA: alpha/beta fold hydrolase [Nannocystaceae bacterium]|nr:alpha/beta fold hydrolase [Nannocystaceae bacterium]